MNVYRYIICIPIDIYIYIYIERERDTLHVYTYIYIYVYITPHIIQCINNKHMTLNTIILLIIARTSNRRRKVVCIHYVSSAPLYPHFMFGALRHTNFNM